MAEYIEREAALDVCEMHYQHCLMMHDYSGDTTADQIKTDIEAIPAADVVEVRHGHWIYWRDADGFKRCKCSECIISYGCIDTPYCPNCGAKMDGKGEGE